MSESASNAWLEMVYDFHFHFEHPIAPSDGRAMSQWRRVARTAWLLEELVEFMAVEELGDQAHEAVDFLYFCWGNFVEIGPADLSPLDAEFEGVFGNLGCPTQMSYKHRVSFVSKAAESVFQFAHTDTRSEQIACTIDAATIMLRCLGVMNVDPRGIMELVQEANMGKLWPDGKPRFSDKGKIIKPSHFEPADEAIDQLLTDRIRSWSKEHADEDIPF